MFNVPILSVHTQKQEEVAVRIKETKPVFDQPLIGVKVSLIMHGRTSDLHSYLIRKCVPANKRPLSEVLGKFTETIPVSLMLQVKQETLVPINAVSLCGSVHILPLLLLFLDTEAQTPR